MIKDSETFIYIIPFHNEFGITFILNVFLVCDLHKFSELKIIFGLPTFLSTFETYLPRVWRGMQSTFWMICLTEPIEHVFRICAEILEPFIVILNHVVNGCTLPAVRFECSDKILKGPSRGLLSQTNSLRELISRLGLALCASRPWGDGCPRPAAQTVLTLKGP